MLTFQEALEKWTAEQSTLNDATQAFEVAFSQAALMAGGSNAEARKASVMTNEAVINAKTELLESQLQAERAKIVLSLAGKQHVIEQMQQAGITALPH